jgi:ABC-type sulfate transport system permease component
MFGVVPSAATLTHCKRELIQALWLLILSTPEFIHAYQFGIFICFADGVIRRVFPRFFAYMADYPEK